MGFNYAPAWRPDPGAAIDGTVSEITSYDGGGYGAYPIVTVKLDEGGEFAVHAFHTVLRNELARLDVQVCEHVAILYAGPQKVKSGDGTYEGYRVMCPDREPKRFDWSDDEAASPQFAESGGNDDLPF